MYFSLWLSISLQTLKFSWPKSVLAVSARSRDARCQHRKGLVQDLHPSTILLAVSLASAAFHSISFGLSCKVEKSDRQGERRCHISFYEEYIDTVLRSDT